MKDEKDTKDLFVRKTLSKLIREQDNRVFPPDYIDKIRFTKEISKEEMEKIREAAKEIKKLAITCKKPIFTAYQQPLHKMRPLPGGSAMQFPATFSFTMRKNRMGLSREQKRNHEPHVIGINDLLANLFQRLLADADFAAKMQFRKVDIPDPAVRWELTQGRNGSAWYATPNDEYGGGFERFSGLVETKKNWVARAIGAHKEEYGDLFSPGEMIRFKDTAEFHIEKEESTRGRPWADTTIVKQDPHPTPIRSFAGNYLHEGDTALVVSDRMLARTIITNKEDWAGTIKFIRELEVLITCSSNPKMVDKVETADSRFNTMLPEPVTQRALIYLAPHKVSGPGQQARLFERMESE